jgi:hypothetical protein
MIRPLAGLAAVLLASSIVLAQPGRTVDLRPKWTKGAESTLVMTIDSKNTVTSPMGLGESDQNVKQEITLREKVVEVDPERGAVVELTYERVKVKFDADAGSFEFDSADPQGKNSTAPKPRPQGDGMDFIDDIAKNAMVPHLQKIAGTKLKVTFDGDGKIISVDGGQNLAVPGLTGPVGGLAPTPKGLDGLFGPISSFTKGDPARVKQGESWTHNDQLELQPFGGLKMTTRHTVKKITGDNAEIAVIGNVEPASIAPGAPFRRTSATYDGSYQWDGRAGRLREMTLRQETNVETTGASSTAMKSASTMKVERRSGPPDKGKSG